MSWSAGLIIVLDQKHVVSFLPYALTRNSHAYVYILTDTHILRDSHRHTGHIYSHTYTFTHMHTHTHTPTHPKRELESV